MKKPDKRFVSSSAALPFGAALIVDAGCESDVRPMLAPHVQPESARAAASTNQKPPRAISAVGSKGSHSAGAIAWHHIDPVLTGTTRMLDAGRSEGSNRV